ncbi:PREDICTED: protein kintoun-like [Amphimedon queenslandica]|uniref:Protein kintoun n=1 Tax=Amphimedon queenslandica TaxID=400682 RepID=A0AAN0IUS5_AMPQE|nr:PREDICTED: protein kintoun-like [Amphimedon queenslandica]|eukprot:XP_011410286.1 PREDICTED: protein kintoun-like [Amphimedon queenslandica]
MAAGSGREDFKMTQDEANRLVEALKKEEFRKLLAEYAEEISNPENKRLYEEEIAKLEQERGVDVKFIHPTPGHVLKTCLVPSKKKVFINICCCDLIEPAMPNEREIGATKTMWSIPYSLTPAREDVDKANNRITIFDAIFNPATYKKGKEMPKFCDLIESTALDGIEKDLKVNIDRKHIKRLKQPYKGNPHPTVIRKRTDKKTPEPIGHLKVPYPPLQEEKNEKKPKTSNGTSTDPTEPKYSIVYSGDFDCQDFTYSQTNNKRPTRIIITIELPKLTTAAKLDVDIYEKLVILHNSDPLYHLELPLAYPVDEDNGIAKFHKQNKSLVLTLQVIPLPVKNHTTLPLSVQDDVNALENNDEVSETENISTFDEESTGEEKLDQINTETSEPCIVKSDWSVMEQWQCPPFSFNQEKDIISFVLHVSQVKASTITYHIDTNSAQITFRSTGAYSFYVSFHEDCRLISNESGFSVSDDNVVLRFKKQVFENKKDNHDWQSFYFGINSNQTEKKDFLNENSLVDIIQSVHYPDPWHTNSLSTPVSTTVNDDKATVTLSTEGKCVQAEDDDTQEHVENPLSTVTVNDDKTVTLSTEGECVDDDKQEHAEKETVLLEEEKDAKEEKPIIIKESIPTFSNTLIFDLD